MLMMHNCVAVDYYGPMVIISHNDMIIDDFLT